MTFPFQPIGDSHQINRTLFVNEFILKMLDTFFPLVSSIQTDQYWGSNHLIHLIVFLELMPAVKCVPIRRRLYLHY